MITSVYIYSMYYDMCSCVSYVCRFSYTVKTNVFQVQLNTYVVTRDKSTVSEKDEMVA